MPRLSKSFVRNPSAALRVIILLVGALMVPLSVPGTSAATEAAASVATSAATSTASSTSTSALSPPLPAFSATYEAQVLANTLTAVIELRPEDEHWRMSLQARASGWVRIIGRLEVERSSVLVPFNGSLRPVFSTNNEVTPRRERNVEIRFDWSGQNATGVINGTPFTHEITEATQDFLSGLLRTVEIVRAGESDAQHTLQILERDRLRDYLMRPAGRETVTTPEGRFETIGMIRSDPSRGVELAAWFAPGLNYLPVRLDYEAGKDIVQLNLKSVVWH